MSAEWVTAIATAGTFLVIAASAIAALLQLRHMRSGNQIAAYNECRETMESADFRHALQFIRRELPDRLRDPGSVENIVRDRFQEEYSGIRMVANLFESMGLFVKSGMMEEKIACELWSGIVVDCWESLSPIIAFVRAQADPGIWVNFEYMAAISNRYNNQFPQGEYPAGVERMPLKGPV
jgi:Domain of unknown function (DUF4760)